MINIRLFFVGDREWGAWQFLPEDQKLNLSPITWFIFVNICSWLLFIWLKSNELKFYKASPDTFPLDKLLQLTLNQHCLDINQTMILEKSTGT